MNRTIENTMLVANAGSGKTHALTTRMVTLLALGVKPRKIAALTFTKKAAGEFLDALFLRLADAATDPAKLTSLQEETKLPRLDAPRCLALLRELTLDAGALSMGTIDSLFAKIARAFPLESGLSGDFTMIGTPDLESARTEALAAVFREEFSDRGNAEAFLDMVRRISRRHGERDVFESLLGAVQDYQEKYLETPPGVIWGDPKTIWPRNRGECAILSAGNASSAADLLWKEIEREHPSLSEAAREKCKKNLDEAAVHQAGRAWSAELKKFVSDKLCKQAGCDKNGDEYIPFGNGAAARVYLRGGIPAARIALRNALLKPEFESLLRRSSSLHAFIKRFEELYDARTRRVGRMTFQDISDLLASHVTQGDWIASAGYRLDTRIDHWLLDEFQDTSRTQWKVLGSFIDEVVQDDGGRRSLLYVGDTKQAIYSWRGGDPELFFEIRDHYNDAGEVRIHEEKLDHSYRSAPVIVDAVNTLFGNISAVSHEMGYPDSTVADWRRAWRAHHVADRNREMQGYVRWEAVEEARSETDQGEEGDVIDRRIVEILEETRPWERGWSCALLKITNNAVASLASLLQSRGIPVAVEGKSNPCTDNPLGAALLAAFRFAASPGDKLSATLLKGSPLSIILRRGEEEFRSDALRRITAEGYEATVRHWVGKLKLPPFLESRFGDFLAAAGEYDEGIPGSVSDFISFLENHSVQEQESSGMVRVMTVHQAKGLTFDMTVVSGLDGKGPASSERLHLGGGHPPSWGCLMPGKELAEADPVMGEAIAKLKSGEEYGKLCTAYVATTRSRHALYILTEKLGEKTTAKNFCRLLMLTLHSASSCYEKGDSGWYEAKPLLPSTVESTSTEVASPSFPPCTAGTPHPLLPSSLACNHEGNKEAPHRAESSLFSPDAADLGTEIHGLLSQIEWNRNSLDLAQCSPEAGRLLQTFLATSEAGTIFTSPGEQSTLWCERAFDMMLDGKWVSGIFDRVHVRREAGKVVAAEIFDYKTNRSSPEAIAHEYASQMELYRQAAAKLLGIDPAHVTARTVPIRRASLVE